MIENRTVRFKMHGLVLVGESDFVFTDPTFSSEAFGRTQADGMVGLGDLPGGTFGRKAYFVSADGSVVWPMWRLMQMGSVTETAGKSQAEGLLESSRWQAKRRHRMLALPVAPTLKGSNTLWDACMVTLVRPLQGRMGSVPKPTVGGVPLWRNLPTATIDQPFRLHHGTALKPPEVSRTHADGDCKRFAVRLCGKIYNDKSLLQARSRTAMLTAQHNARGVAIAATILLAFSHVTLRTGRAEAAAPPERANVPASTAPNSVVTFHTFDIEEVFSNLVGSVQFIELRESAGLDDEFHFAGNQLTSDANVFIYPTDLPDPATANRTVLVATAAFAALPGAVTPDYIIPERFFDVTGDTISIFETQTNTLVDTFVFGAPPCPCDADVDNNGVVNALDGACIMECRGGDCSCCLSSCDINCDGVVDTGDVGDDVINDPSAWLCLFQGAAPEICCPGPTGACCDTVTGACTDSVFAIDCDGAGLVWSEALGCSQVTCTGLPTGACCDLSRGACDDDVLASQCSGIDLVWSEALNCASVTCPAPPGGACCNEGNGQCQDGVIEVDCTGPDQTWTTSTLCSAVSCTVPPQDPCTCDGDVDNNDIVDVNDGVCIAECKAGDCSCCLSSCDVNCDGVVDAGDAGDDIINDPSAWLCLFQGGAPEVCCPAPAAVSSAIALDGACCNVGNGQCQDGVPELNCTGIKLVWTALTTCSELSCIDTFLPTDGALSLNKDGTTGVNSPTNFAGEMGSVNAAPSIPAMSRTALVVMMLLFVTAAVAITGKRRRGISPST